MLPSNEPLRPPGVNAEVPSPDPRRPPADSVATRGLSALTYPDEPLAPTGAGYGSAGEGIGGFATLCRFFGLSWMKADAVGGMGGRPEAAPEVPSSVPGDVWRRSPAGPPDIWRFQARAETNDKGSEKKRMEVDWGIRFIGEGVWRLSYCWLHHASSNEKRLRSEKLVKNCRDDNVP